MVMAGKARRRALTLALIALTLATSPASARQWSAVCSNLSGVRVDDPAAEPTFTQDMLKGASWAYSWNTDTRKATLILPASHASDGRSHKLARSASFPVVIRVICESLAIDSEPVAVVGHSSPLARTAAGNETIEPTNARRSTIA